MSISKFIFLKRWLLGIFPDSFLIEIHNRKKRRSFLKIIKSKLPLLKDNIIGDRISNKAPIYFLWWQGRDSVPYLVEQCYENLLKHRGNHPVIFIDEKNLSDIIGEKHYKFIADCIKEGISITNTSDLIRFCLLSKGEGIWIDSTIFLLKDIDSIINEGEFYSIRLKVEHKKLFQNPAKGRWTSFFIGAGNNCKLMDYMYESLKELIKKTGHYPDYYSHDILFSIAYLKNKSLRKHIQSIKYTPDKLFELNDGYKPVEITRYQELKEILPFFKLTWKNAENNANYQMIFKLND